MRSSFALIASSIASLALAQGFFTSSDVPACALQCSLLNQAQSACPATSNQPATCFCNSNFLVNLLSAPQSICPECTAQSDLSQLTGWFNQFCRQGGSSTWSPNGAATSAPAATATTAPPASTTVPTNPDATTAPPAAYTPATNANAGGTSSSYTDPNAGKSWWDLHKGWIAMVIVLVVAFAAIIAGGVWWKKRYLRKRNAAGATLPGAWGPSGQPAGRFSTEQVEKYGGSAAVSPVAAADSGESTKHKIARSLRRS